MTRMTAGEVCRLVVEGPSSRVDLSVPVGVPLCDLLPSMLHHLGSDLADLGLDHGGWVLQRLGEEPLEEDRTPAELGLHDGERLYLRPRSSLVPPLDFDDLVDGMASGARDRSATWSPRHTTAAGHLAAVLAVGAVVAVLVRTSQLVPATALLAATAVLLVVAAGLTSALARTAGTARMYGVLAVLVAAVTPATSPVSAGTPWGLVTSVLWCGAVAVAAALAVRRRLPVVALGLGTGVLAALLAGAALLLGATPLTLPAVAVLVTAVTLLLRVGFPALAFRLAGQRLPPLPRDVDDIQHDIDPAPGDEVVRAAARTEAFLTALAVAAGVTVAGTTGLLATGGGWSVAVAVAVAVNLTLSVRPLSNAWQRCAWLSGPVVVTLVLVWRAVDPASVALDATGLSAVLAVLLVLAWAGPVVARAIVRRTVDPRIGRLGDIAQTVSLVLAGPFAVLALGVGDLVRRTVG